MFQIKIDDDVNLKLIWLHRHFQQIVKVLFYPKMRDWYIVIGFVYGSSTSTWSRGKYVMGILSTNLFAV